MQSAPRVPRSRAHAWDSAIIQAAKAERCDLIVMGTHGQGALQRLLLGSVASKVIAQTDIPVTVVR